jgi:hypothetical protein
LVSDGGLPEEGVSEADLAFRSGFLGLLIEAVVSIEPLALKILSGLLTGVISLPSGFYMVCLLPDASLCFSGVAK